MSESGLSARARTAGIELSRVAYGTWRLGDDPDRHEPRRYRQKIEMLIERGVTSFDLADLYGDYGNEAFFGQSVSRDPAVRRQIEIVTKCGIKQPGQANPGYRVRHYDSSYAHIIASAEASLRNLETEYLDLFLIHRPDLLMDAEATARALDELVSSGKVRAVGVSNFSPTQVALLRSRLQAPIAVHELEVSVAVPDALHDGRLDQCQQHYILPLVYSPLGARVLFDHADPTDLRQLISVTADRLGVSVDVVALAWVLALPTRPSIILGSHRSDRLLEQIKAFDLRLDRQDWYALWRGATGRL